MFTVLIRSLSDNREILIPAKSVEYRRTGKEAGLRIQLTNGTSSHYGHSSSEKDARDVFIMNASGKTVARYLL